MWLQGSWNVLKTSRSHAGVSHRSASCCSRPSHRSNCWIMTTFLLLLFLIETNAIEWLAIVKRKEHHWNRTADCRELDTKTLGVSSRQKAHCRRHRELMPVVVQAARQTTLVCQQLFFDSRWNCSSVALAPGFMADLKAGSREQALVYALASASLVQAMARECATGNTGKCTCGRLPSGAGGAQPRDFRWGGCSDNVQYGLAFSRAFVGGTTRARGAGERSPQGLVLGAEERSPQELVLGAGEGRTQPSKRVLMNQHNSQAGRRRTMTSLSTACKCHGVSGSCSLKTCWRAILDLRSVGASLMKSYYTAVEVGGATERGGRDGNTTRLTAVNQMKRDYSEDDLIYYTKSSDYCLPDRTLGSIGTYNRECEKDNPGSIGCRSMCCGRGYNSHMTNVTYRCDCKYYWCCYVKCKTCAKNVEVNRCR